MASLRPGILSKLLQNVDNNHFKVAGQHRSALLQVIGIVPALDGAGDDDPWKSKGFFLRVSDSVHSAYVSLSDEDLDLVLSDKIQLGQFIHITRLDSGSPVPVLRGVKPVPKRWPCVGDPKDLISSDLLQVPNLKLRNVKAKPKEKKVASEELESRRLSMGNGKVEGLELRRLSLDSTRKGWDRSPGIESGVRPVLRSKVKDTSDNHKIVSGRKASSENNSTMEHTSLSVSPLKNKNIIVPPKLISKPVKNDLKSSIDASIPSHLIKLPTNSKTWSDLKISWDLLPPAIHALGKETVAHKNAAFFTAVSALEEASAAEGVVRCMSMFAELCASSRKDSAGPLVKQFLNLHQSIQKAAAIVDVLLRLRFPEAKGSTNLGSHRPLPEMHRDTINKNSKSWVQAAVTTDLSKFSVFTREDEMDILNGDKCHYVILESTTIKNESENHSPQNKQNPRNHGAAISNISAKGSPSQPRPRVSKTKNMNISREVLSKHNGLQEASSLADKLILVSREWFLNYLEDSLNDGFGLRKGEGGSEVRGLLGQLKRVNQWLDDSAGNENRVNEKIEDLKKKLYRFLLEHVDSTIVAGR